MTAALRTKRNGRWYYWTGIEWEPDVLRAKRYARSVKAIEVETVTINRYSTRANHTDPNEHVKTVDHQSKRSLGCSLMADGVLSSQFWVQRHKR